MPLGNNETYLTDEGDELATALSALSDSAKRALIKALGGFVPVSGSTPTEGAVAVFGADEQEIDAVAAEPLTDPGADRILFWDFSASALTYLSVGTGLEISGTTLNGTGEGGGVGTDPEFTTIELGHATDTTLARIAAGRVSIEGAEIATLTGAQTLSNKTLTAPALGTPASGVLTNCSGLPASGLVASTSQAVGFGSIELGHASDTTLTRSAAGTVAVEGVDVVTLSATQTLANKTLTSPTLTTPALGTPASGNLANCTAYPAASDTASGIAELATIAEVNTGTDTARAVTPDALAGSYAGTKEVTIMVFDDSQNVAVADGAGDVFYRIPSTFNGMNLVAVAAQVQTAGTTGTTDVQITRIRSGSAVDMLSTKLTIDSAEIDTATAATPAVINATNDDVATGDQIRIDVDAASTTAPKGLLVEMQFRLP